MCQSANLTICCLLSMSPQPWIHLYSNFHWKVPHSFKFEFIVRPKLRIIECLFDMSDFPSNLGIDPALPSPKVSNLAFFFSNLPAEYSGIYFKIEEL